MSQDLDQVIPVDNPLEPSKGGYLKAYLEHYQPAAELAGRHFDECTGKLSAPFFNLGLKEEIPKLNLETGEIIHLSSCEVRAIDDFRLISVQTAHKLGLEIEHQDHVIQGLKRAQAGFIGTWLPITEPELMNREDCDCTKSNYFQATLKHGYLVSLDTLANRDFVKALDQAALSNKPSLPSFNDNRFQSVFNLLQRYMERLNIPTQIRWYYEDHDRMQEDFNISKGGKVLKSAYREPWSYRNTSPSPFATLNGLPPPHFCKSENSFLRIGAHLVTNAILDNALTSYIYKKAPPFEFTQADQDLMRFSDKQVKDIAGTMFAAHQGVEMTQNEVNRFNANYGKFYTTFPMEHAQKICKLAAKAATYALDLDLAPNLKHTEQDTQQASLWETWKDYHSKFALHMATPSLSAIAKSLENKLSPAHVLHNLTNLVAHKSQALSSHQEQLKEELQRQQR